MHVRKDRRVVYRDTARNGAPADLLELDHLRAVDKAHLKNV